MPKEVITCEEAAQLLFVARPRIAQRIADGVLTATAGTLTKSEVLEYKSTQRAATKDFLSGETEGYWSLDGVSTSGREPPKS
jgi:hypothetical protein